MILPYWKGRHPDHYTASTLGYEACFLAGLAKLDMNQAVSSQPSAFSPDLAPHRPFKIIYATLYYDVRPTFVVDISEQFEERLQSLLAYTSQFGDQEAGKDIFPAAAEIRTASTPWLGITACWQASLMPSHSCRRKWDWLRI